MAETPGTTALAGGGAAQASVGVGRIVLASLVGTTIEFYDFYIYGTAAALVIGQTFFPQSAPGSQALNAFLTFGIAFLARPVGSVLFGHFGDRIGRKSTLVASMLVMGLSTTLIGILPGYAQAGVLAPWLLCLLRFGQGVGLGGEWGGAALLATENAPRGRRAWFGMFPQLGPPLGFFMANGLFLALLLGLGEESFVAWAWRIPFLISAVLVAIGLYLRTSISETPAFRETLARNERVRVPLLDVLADHWLPLIQGSLSIVVCYALFYISTVFALGYGVNVQHIPRTNFLGMLCVAVLFMAAATPLSAALADRFGRRPVLLGASVLAALVGFALPSLLSGGAMETLLFLSLALGAMGLTFAPLGALLPELFPTAVAYTGASSAYNLGGILGASLAPYLAQLLLERGGLPWVGDYLILAATISFLSVLSMKETRKA
ncbi:MFS transporter [Methylocapsa sp. S129]|uniref:MFS transporter n=1 Tax=Methylocapsa sp. S129 TaxID=1641869 RepID=UPI00131CF8D3|nr:MFS transporter [Methylocapsa sp. S129]